MTPKVGLARRLVLAFAVFGLVLASLYGLLLYLVFHGSEDGVQQRMLHLELRHLEEAGLEAPGGPVTVLSRFITAYRGINAAPEPLRSRLARLGPGTHELGTGAWRPHAEGAYQVEVADLASGQRLYLVLDTTEFEAGAEQWAMLAKAVGVALLIVLAAGIGLGWAVATSVVRPVVELAGLAASSTPGELGSLIEPRRYPGEVGQLAGALKSSLLRVGAFVERERQFTANASHELRTPVTVIKGAAELLAAHPAAADPPLGRPLDRIRRATASLEEIIEVFLLLAREDAVRPEPGGCLLRAAAEQVVELHSGLTVGKPVAVVVVVAEDARIAAPRQVLLIVLGNLVRNALERVASGTVTVSGDAAAVTVQDTGPGIPHEMLGKVLDRHARGPVSTGHGLGLDIVRTLCSRCGWRLEMTSVEGAGTRATLLFGDGNQPVA